MIDAASTKHRVADLHAVLVGLTAKSHVRDGISRHKVFTAVFKYSESEMSTLT